MFEKEKQDIMDAEAILVELDKLIESEQSENEEGEEADIRELKEAKAHLEAFIAAEEKEEGEEPVETKPEMTEVKPVVDTGTLTGPLSSLKNFLIKKSQNNIQK
jgi:hypothetical protein